MATGWNLWVWLECIGVMGVVVRMYIDILIIIITCLYSTCNTVELPITPPRTGQSLYNRQTIWYGLNLA